jgi:hypothetical protein
MFDKRKGRAAYCIHPMRPDCARLSLMRILQHIQSNVPPLSLPPTSSFASPKCNLISMQSFVPALRYLYSHGEAHEFCYSEKWRILVLRMWRHPILVANVGNTNGRDSMAGHKHWGHGVHWCFVVPIFGWIFCIHAPFCMLFVPATMAP